VSKGNAHHLSTEVMTTSDLLIKTEAAIEKALAAEAYSIRAREPKRARLKDLAAFRRELLTEINDAANSGRMFRAVEVGNPR